MNVHCEGGETAVLNDLQRPVQLESMRGRSVSCHEIEVSYNSSTDADLERIQSLIDVSSECSQDIQLEVSGASGMRMKFKAYRGNHNTFFIGDERGERICSCQENNKGRLSNASSLPMAWIRYGSMPKGSNVKLSLGSLRCNGEKQFNVRFKASGNRGRDNPIPAGQFWSFDHVEINDGEALDSSSGEFEAPTSGHYLFRVSAYIPYSASNYNKIMLYKNEDHVANSAYDQKDVKGEGTIVMRLDKGDKIRFKSSNTQVFDCEFSGQYLKENEYFLALLLARNFKLN